MGKEEERKGRGKKKIKRKEQERETGDISKKLRGQWRDGD